MKNGILILTGFLFFVNDMNAQISDSTIVEIAKEHLVKYDDLSPDASNRFPKISFHVFDVNAGTYVFDVDMKLPVNDSLSYYRISTLGPHVYIHLMFVKKGDCVIINMRNSFFDIINHGITLCEKLNLNYKETLYVLKEILHFSESNYDNQGGESIIE